MGAEAKGYDVMIKSTETVAATVPVQEHRLPQSNFDLLLPPIDVGVFFCFQKPSPISDSNAASVGPTTFPAMVATLKVALAKVISQHECAIYVLQKLGINMAYSYAHYI